MEHKYKDESWLRKNYLEEEMTMREMAKIANCGHNTIRRWLHHYAIEIREKNPHARYKNKEWLREKYHEEAMTTEEIRKICNCSRTTICYWLKKHGIEIQGTKPEYQDKELLKEKYLKEEMSMAEIGEIMDCNDTTICRWLHKHGIKTRNEKGGGPKFPNHLADLTSFGQQFLDGLMLGDGGMDDRLKSANYYHGDSYQEYIEWLSEKLSEIGLENETREKKTGRYSLETKFYRELKDQYKEWYPTGHRKTRIPARVEITPVILFNWFIGDGTYPQEEYISIGSTTFEEGYSRTIQQIKDLGISCTKVEDGFIILKESHEDFFDYILSSGIEIPPKYKYKFPDNRIKPK